ncbi:MAG: zinc-dependent alcohol dehydrogenase family protein [Chloroflexota bacterium]
MRAMVLLATGPASSSPLAATERVVPEPGPGELRLRVTACGVCRTDLQICEGDLPARRLPIVPGHQVVGVVDTLGPDVAGWSAGDRAGVTWLAGTDATCRFCVSGRENLCEAATFTGWDRDGGYAEAIIVRAAYAVPLPAAFPDLAAAPLLCGGVIGYRALRVAGIGPASAGARLGLYGFGASARLALQVARAWGVDAYVATRAASERARAIELGAAWAGGLDERPPVALDAAVTFAPVGSVVAAALRALDRGGVVAINAIHLDRVPELPYEDLWWERSIRSVANVTRDDAREFLTLAARTGITTDVETHPLAAANTALARLAAGQVAGTAVLVVDPVASRG